MEESKYGSRQSFGLAAIEYLAKLDGQCGGVERLLNEVRFASVDTLAKHGIGCVAAHEDHGDRGVFTPDAVGQFGSSVPRVGGPSSARTVSTAASLAADK